MADADIIHAAAGYLVGYSLDDESPQWELRLWVRIGRATFWRSSSCSLTMAPN
ncbi:hypothetical protein [Parafrankia sp. FMc2]|uniref:hypothetical protein n=1 Tax=Parafrankia sp. FMc2 TaxID=3233196 RepID=UPI003B58786C